MTNSFASCGWAAASCSMNGKAFSSSLALRCNRATTSASLGRDESSTAETHAGPGAVLITSATRTGRGMSGRCIIIMRTIESSWSSVPKKMLPYMSRRRRPAAGRAVEQLGELGLSEPGGGEQCQRSPPLLRPVRSDLQERVGCRLRQFERVEPILGRVRLGRETARHDRSEGGEDFHPPGRVLGEALVQPRLAEFVLEARGEFDRPQQPFFLLARRPARHGEDCLDRRPCLLEVPGLRLLRVQSEEVPGKQVECLQVRVRPGLLGAREELAGVLRQVSIAQQLRDLTAGEHGSARGFRDVRLQPRDRDLGECATGDCLAEDRCEGCQVVLVEPGRSAER